MTAAELAAYIGAAAWFPQIATWIYRALVRPAITVVPDRYAEVGFTSLGPIFNVGMAFACDRKGAVIDGFDLLVRHADGETRTFRWSGLRETFSEIRDDAGNRQVVSRDQTPIALKIGTESLVEKFVRFQEPRYHETVRPALSNLIAHINFLKRTNDPELAAKALNSKEMFDALDVRQKSFWWRPGRYTATIRLSSPSKFQLANSVYSFDLSQLHIDQLRQNCDTIRTELENAIRSDLPNFQAVPVNWNWANVDVQKSNAG